MTRQGYIKYYMMTGVYNDVPLQDWRVFVHDIKTHSGKHRHQGGLVIYVLEGRGYSVVDGERKDWEKGDLLLLPIKPGGVEHQHYNLEPGKGCRWIAFLHEHVMENLALLIEQTEESPQYRNQQP
jgi:gentisate 1,2-dioxygenase